MEVYGGKRNQDFFLFPVQDDREAIEKRFDDLISIAKLITNTNFLLKLRDLEMTERRIMKKLLQFLSKHVILNVSEDIH